MNRNQFNIPLTIVSAFFAVIYSLISLVNHYYFRTAAIDLGLYTNALYDYMHFQWNDSSVFKEASENLLADHFDLYLIIFSPLSLIFKTYTLLIVQIVFVLLGGIGVYRYFTIAQPDRKVALLAAIYFYLFFAVFSAIAWDYHSNVVAAALVPWFLFRFKQKKYFGAAIIFLTLLVAKENISLWVCFISIGLMYDYRNDKISLRFLLFFALISLSYFIIITGITMPSLSNDGNFHQFQYSILGNNSFEAFQHLIAHPLQSVETLFVNHTQNPSGNYVKSETHILLLLSGLIFLFLKPNYLFMLIPVYVQKYFHDNYFMWSIGGQYSVEFAPIFAIGIFSVISRYGNKIALILCTVVLTGVFISTIRTMDRTVIFTDKSRIRIYQLQHYQRSYNVKMVHEELNKIPSEAIVSAQSQFVPHLALRDKIYQFPIIKDAEYIIYSLKENTYPLSKKEFEIAIDEINHSDKWKILFQSTAVVILKKD
jgi:uncharacterized membrane protein